MALSFMEQPHVLTRSQDVASVPPHDRLQQMVSAHFDGLWLFLRRLGVLEVEIDDAIQEVIFVAASRLADITVGSERSFLFSTAFRVASASRRKRAGRYEVGDEVLFDQQDPAPWPDALTDQARARAMLDGVLAQMPIDLRAVFVLYEIDERTMTEIAAALDLAPGTVASRLRRARVFFDTQVGRIQARADFAGGTS